MIDSLKAEAAVHGDRLQIIDVRRLPDLKRELEQFARSPELNGFQQWIVKSLYCYDVPETGFTVRSVILLALSHPFYADVVFHKDDRKYFVKCLVRPDYEGAEHYLRFFLEKIGYQNHRAPNLPMKRLGVQSGLSEYGRNNITYIPGMGSNFSLVTYFSDMPCEVDTWRSPVMAPICEKCRLCLNHCPTGAIRENRFLIDNSKCLSAMNESPEPFPDWLPESVHHTCYDCLRCQEVCPMNHGQLNKLEQTVIFSAGETHMILNGAPFESFSEEARRKIIMLGMDDWYAAIPRNIGILLK